MEIPSRKPELIGQFLFILASCFAKAGKGWKQEVKATKKGTPPSSPLHKKKTKKDKKQKIETETLDYSPCFTSVMLRES